MDNISLDILPKEPDRIFAELRSGNMVIARSKNDFLYILDFNDEFHMFSHTPGAPGGGQHQFPKDEKYTATVRKVVDLADAVYLCEFDKSMNLYGVMASAEDGILSLFPGDDRDSDEELEFIIPDKNANTDEPDAFS